MLLPDSLMLLGPAFSFAVQVRLDSCLSPPPAKLSMVQGEPPGWRTPVFSMRCWWMRTAGATISPLTLVQWAPGGDHRAGNTMANLQTDEHMIFIKEQGWFPVCCSRSWGLTLCCSLGFSCCLLSLLTWQSCVLPRNICSCVLLVPGCGVVWSKIPCRWGRWRRLPETTWTHSALIGVETEWWFDGSLNPSPVFNACVGDGPALVFWFKMKYDGYLEHGA